MDFAAARRNMVECQLRPNKVTDDRILEAMGTVPRELYVPATRRSLAYLDEDLRIGEGRHLMEPVVLGRLLQAANCREEDVALVVGCATGYAAAIVARLVATVFAVEATSDAVADASERLGESGVDNAIVVEGALDAGCPAHQPYDVILIDGGVEYIPEALVAQLSDRGRLLAVEVDGPRGEAVLIRRIGGTTTRRPLFDAFVPILPEFRKVAGFVF